MDFFTTLSAIESRGMSVLGRQGRNSKGSQVLLNVIEDIEPDATLQEAR